MIQKNNKTQFLEDVTEIDTSQVRNPVAAPETKAVEEDEETTHDEFVDEITEKTSYFKNFLKWLKNKKG